MLDNTAKKIFVPSKYQSNFFDWIMTGKGSSIVTAVAGSGKTTTAIQAQVHIPDPLHMASVQLLAFNTIIAKELNARLDTLRQETGLTFHNRKASTFHSLGFGALRKHFGARTRINVDGKKLRTIFERMVPEHLVETYSDFCVKLVSLAKGQGIGCLTPDLPQAWWGLIEHHDLFLSDTNASEETAIDLARGLLSKSTESAQTGWIDFDDQLYLVIKWKLRLDQHDYLFVDEAQDTNPVRRALCRLALKPGGRLIALGDRCQAIYGFTGASSDSLDLIKKEFGCIELPLTVSYRCAKSIIREATRVVSHIEAFENSPEGVVETLPMSKAFNQFAKTDAILCRQTSPLIELAYYFISRGVGAKVLGRDIGAGLTNLVKKQRAKNIDGLEKKLAEYAAREIAKFTAKGEEQKAEAVADRVACITKIIENLHENERSIPKLIARIEAMFSDEAGVLTLSTIHKAKGREWSTVGIWKRELMPSKWAKQEHQLAEERNLEYVAITRAMNRLIYLEDDVK